jgi:hypothetical protein
MKPPGAGVGGTPLQVAAHPCSLSYSAFGLIGTTFTELDWKTLIFFRESGFDKSKRMVSYTLHHADTSSESLLTATFGDNWTSFLIK